ncbi:hypothetical protein [Hymenobacter cellulosivorans]|uniref:Uncharacterized protein n=1 Tax=Hymenobacter cellulosivorans TaxID=2932249 RepID=A0ABY4FFZ0_9BACT|nr:hypothetical protein [Hymenobacter cellulosivorans]UOQ55455.1 hypothetical protein MUN80_12010 [Hymenobacter cellulosivorans]
MTRPHHLPPPQPWIRSAAFDGLWVLSPPFVALLLVLLLPATFRTSAQMPLLGWLVLVVFIDVAHVYSTLFRTYFDPTRRREQQRLLWLVPLGCYAAGVALHQFGSLVFWRVLAYLAVFHFIRQQYGFLRLYQRQEPTQPHRWLDTALVYYATIYPLLYWHFSAPRNFTWFVEGDFVQHDWPAGRWFATGLYVALVLLYLAKEIRQWLLLRLINWPRNLLLAGTAVSWYFGIVYFNGDLAFTLLNVVSHGIPYLALIWISRPAAANARVARPLGQIVALVGFLGLLFGLAYLEEGIWDGLVWREHAAAFGWFQQLPAISSTGILAWVVPLLALPQATHYVLDGFIWRRPKPAA